MKVYKFNRNKFRKKTAEGNPYKIVLNLLNENKNMKLSSLSKHNNINNTKKAVIQINKSFNYIPNIKEKLSENGKNSINKFGSFKTINSNNIDYNNDSYEKRHSLQILSRKTNKLLNKYNFKINNENIKNRIKNKINTTPILIDTLEKNIKNVLNNMKIEIEEKARGTQIETNISPVNKKFKFTSNPNLEIIFGKKTAKSNKKRSLRNPFLDDYFHSGIDLYFKIDKNIIRSQSFEINQIAKKKLFKRIKNKIHKELYYKSINDTSNHNTIEEDSENNENDKGTGLHPNSKFILIFDFLLIIANLYYFIWIPLKIAQNKDIFEKKANIKEIIYYFIDIIFLADFIISFFRGYYNFEMEIVRNNKKIITNYLKEYFFFDLLEAIPIFSIIKIFVKSNNMIYYYSYNLDGKTKLLTFSLFIKPFKIFKILEKKKNKALEDFYTYLSVNYYLEELTKFLIYFFIFFLFIHLFICMHIYLSFQNYPNWITNINIINKSFFDIYIASFYFMITTITTVGYGDIVCISFIERIYHIILLVIGTLLYTFLVSKIGNYLREQSYEEIKLSKDLNILENIRITYPSMPFKLYSKIKSHLQSIFKKRKKTGISLLINEVPDAIKNELLFKIYANVINGFSIFKNVKNSNFVYQALTSFIPIVSKKEEIIILEGDIIQNIVFVKDGRLSMEIAINLNDPCKSIQKYIESNFIGISREDELLKSNISIVNKNNSFLPAEKKNYNDLMKEIDNILLDNQKSSKIHDSINKSNRISFDLGRMDFLRNEDEETNIEEYQTIKIMDIRKNEHYGDIHLFNEQPSPFTVKAKSRIADLFLLPKHDAIKLSKNFQNIWKRIQNKSYHNLVSIKKLTFKTLKQYYNTHINNKNIRGNNLALNLDVTKNSLNVSELGNITSNIKDKKIEKNENKSFTSKNNLGDINNINNKLIKGNTPKSKNSIDLDNELNISESINPISILNSNKNCHNLIIKENQEKNDSFDIKEENKISKKIIQRNNSDNFSFKNDENNNFTLLSPKKLSNKMQNKLQIRSSKLNTFKEFEILTYSQNDNNKKNQSENNYSNESLDNQTIKIVPTNSKINYKESNNIISLEDMNKKFSKKIIKKMKKRKKIQRIKKFLKIQKKINKNLLELLMKQNSVKKENSFENVSKYPKFLNYSISTCSDFENFSEILDSTYSEESNLSISKCNYKFEIKALKLISLESFEIKSCYKNINSLTKGRMAINKKYQKFVENLIKKTNIPKASKLLSSVLSENSKKEQSIQSKEKSFYSKESISEKNNEEDFFSRKKEISIKKQKNKNIIFSEQNNLSNKKLNAKRNSMNSMGNLPIFKEDKKIIHKRKSTKFSELKKANTFDNKNRDYLKKTNINYINNNINKQKNGKEIINEKRNQIYNSKKSNNNLIYENKNRKIIILSSNENVYNNKFKIVDNNKSNLKIIQDNNFEKENVKKCIIF